MEVKSDALKNSIAKKKKKDQYCLGTCNVRSINQGKLDMVKYEMATLNTDILGISEWEWRGMVEFNSDKIVSTTVCKNPFEEME